MVKLFWEPQSSVYQRVEFKYGFTDMQADETYLGLTTADLRRNPNRRYAASRFDQIDTEQHRSYLRHFISPTENFDLVTTAYYNKFARNWFKLQDIRDVGGSGQTLGLSAALAGASATTPGDGLACLQGELACILNVRGNDRSYYSYGVQSEGVLRFRTGQLAHSLTVGLRYHNDIEDRFQKETRYNQANNGAILSQVTGLPGSQDNREGEVEAIALWVEDRIEIGRWWFTPGLRFETLDLENRDKRPGRTFAKEELDMLGGGLGAGYQLSDAWQAFAGIHFGFSPPSPGGAVNGLEEETSIGYELGVRYRDANRSSWPRPSASSPISTTSSWSATSAAPVPVSTRISARCILRRRTLGRVRSRAPARLEFRQHLPCRLHLYRCHAAQRRPVDRCRIDLQLRPQRQRRPVSADLPVQRRRQPRLRTLGTRGQCDHRR